MSIERRLRTVLLAGAMTAPLLCAPEMIRRAEAAAPVSAAIAWHPGFVIRAEDRFDPAVQRLMAEYSLRSLPLDRGQLYYLYPIGVTPRLEGVQIRYLESLLDKQASAAEASAAEASAAEAAGAESPATGDQGAAEEQEPKKE